MKGRPNVLILVVDALSDRFLRPLLEEDLTPDGGGRLPNLRALARRAEIDSTCTSIFPSITHAALASLATGVYPRDHAVLGSYWYRRAAEEIAYFSADLEMVLERGVDHFIHEFLIELNQTILRAPTLAERLEGEGVATAVINYLIYRGGCSHPLNLPLLLSLIPGLSLEPGLTVKGARYLFLGDFVADGPIDVTRHNGGPLKWFGLGDEGTADVLAQLLEKEALPPLTIAYFPTNDKRSHDLGPARAHEQLSDLDAAFGQIFDAAGGLERLLSHTCVVLTGDHSQSEIDGDPEAAVIDLESRLADFRPAHPGRTWQDGEELLICPNMRAAVLYTRGGVARGDLLAALRPERRIDQFIWRDGEGRYVVDSRAGRLTFSAGEEAVDRYGNGWRWEGELAAVDGRVSDGEIIFPNYPNAFERIAGLLDSPDSGDLWLTARPGVEFEVSLTSPHIGGGSHGSLHRVDSVAPLLVAGCRRAVRLPQPARLVDIAPFCAGLLGLDL